MHCCYICKNEIPEEQAEHQNASNPPGNFLACIEHLQKVATLNTYMRQIQERRRNGVSDRTLAPQLKYFKDLKKQYGV